MEIDEMGDAENLDDLIAENVREFEMNEVRRHQLSAAEREKMLTQTLGARSQPAKDETFLIGDAAAGITPRSVWFEFRRIQFAAIISIGVGDTEGADRTKYCIDINCTVRRSYRISVDKIVDTDNFLSALSQYISLKIVPTVEEDMRERRRVEELAAANEADAARRHRRMEFWAQSQQKVMDDLLQVECAPRVSFGVIV